MQNIHGATNYNEYVKYIYLNTNLTESEAFTTCNYYWNHGVHKNEAIKAINAGATNKGGQHVE